MKKSLQWIIRHALEDARGKGRDRFTETTLAVRAVCRARPALTAMEAVAAVRVAQRRRPSVWTAAAPHLF